MPFRVVSGVGQGMGVLDGGDYRLRERAVSGVNMGRPIVTNGTATRCDKLFPDYFGEDLLFFTDQTTL